MAFFFRKKKKNNPVPHDGPSQDGDEHKTKLDRNKLDDLQDQIDRLQEQVDKAKAQETYSTRPSDASGRVNDSQLVRGLPTPRNHSLTRSEAASRHDFALTDATKSGIRGPRRSIAEIVIDKDPFTGKSDSANTHWKSGPEKRTTSINSKSIASSHGDGEVFYKDGKKYRRVVRMVRPVASKDPGLFVGTPSSFRSLSSARGREEVTDGHVQAMTARFSMNSVTSDVSKNSRVSSTSKGYGQKKTLRVRTVADSYPFQTPTQNNDRKSPMTQTECSPIPANMAASNPWMRNKIKQQNHLQVNSETTRPSTPAAISQWMQQQSDRIEVRGATAKSRPEISTFHKNQMDSSYGKPSSVAKKSPFQPDIFTPSQSANDIQRMPKPLDKNPPSAKSAPRHKLLTPHETPSGILNGKLPFKAAEKSQNQFSPREIPNKSRKSDKPSFKATGDNLKLFSTTPLPPMIESNEAMPSMERVSKIPTVKDKSPKKPKEEISKHNENEQMASSAPRPWKLPFSKPEKKTPPPLSTGGRTQPVNLLNQIKKQDVKLKKISPAQQDTSKPSAVSSGKAPAGARSGPIQQSKSQGNAPNPGDLLAGIRAGVALKKVDKATIPAPKKHVSPMAQLLAQIQEKKAECLRREREADPDEVDW